MSNKKKESVLGLTPAQPPRLSVNGRQSLFSSSRAVTQREQSIIDQWHEHTLIIEGQAAKTFFGLDKAGEIDQHAITAFTETAAYIQSCRLEAQGTPQQHYVDEFSHHLTGITAQHILAGVDVGVANIGAVMREPLSAPREWADRSEQKGWLRRVLGI